jgi:serine phosphatase RsbU (regulator of sigma subunit)/PAS domain-containing protein/anti-sigma regulatory factor (Ser/Thr protein kinase)
MDLTDSLVHGPAVLAGASLLCAAVADADGTVVEWTPGAEGMLGYRADEIVGKPFGVLCSDDIHDELQARLLRGPPSSLHTVLRHKEDNPVGAEVFSVALPGPVAPRRLLVVTEAPYEENLGSTLKQWALDQLPFVASISDAELRYVHANRLGARALNLPAEGILGRKLEDVLQNTVSGDVFDDMRRAVATGEPRTIEVYDRLPHEPHGHAWCVYNTPLKDPAGRVHGLYTVGVDITGEYEARKRLVLLTRASGAIGSTLDVSRTADELLQVLVPELADVVTVDLLDSLFGEHEPSPALGSEEPVLLRRVAVRSSLPGMPDVVLTPGEKDVYPPASPHGRALATGTSYLSPADGAPGFEDWVARWVADNPRRAEIHQTYRYHSVMAVPLRARGTTLGVACYYRHQQPAPFDADDLLLAEEISARAAVSLDNALRYTRERATALTLQHSLLPQELPKLAGVEVAGRYLASDVQGGVGGDWFDVIPLSGARVALVVGDVVGHGIHASASMGRLRTAVRTLADIELQPDELLARLDDLVGSSFGAASRTPDEPTLETGATCLYAVYDPVSRVCTLARAGHPPPALVRPDGTAEFLDIPSGPPLGVGGMPFEKIQVELEEGSLIALYTDGLVESRHSDVDRGLDELCRRLARPAASLSETCDTVLGALPAGPPPDDVALLVARTRMLDPGNVVDWEFPTEPVAVAKARDCAVRQLADWGLDEVSFGAELVVSELVTNAIRHASGPVRLRLIREGGLICEVSDGSSTFPRPRRARSDDEGGRGLMLVARLSRRWGTRPTDNGKIIWSEHSLPGAAAEGRVCGI